MSIYTDEQEEIQFSEPILAQKGVRCGITHAEKGEWEVKEKKVWTPEQSETMASLIGNTYDCLKLKLSISDDTIKTASENAKPKTTLEDQFNIVNYPFPDKKTGALKKMGKQKLYELEGAFGFDPVFKVAGTVVEPFVTKSGAKVAPKIEGVTRSVNPDFFNAYFTVTKDEDGKEHAIPITSNWVGKVIYVDVGVEKSEQFGAKNVVDRYVKPPVM